MIIKIILLVIFIVMSILVMTIHVTDKYCTKRLFLTGISLWILGIYIGLAISSLFKV